MLRYFALASLLLVIMFSCTEELEYGKDHGDNRIFGSLGVSEDPYEIFPLTDGFLIIAYGTDPLVIKTDTEGNKVWEKNYDGGILGNRQRGNKPIATVTPDGGYIIVGRYSLDEGMWIIKINEDGDLLWTKTYKEAEPWSIASSINGGYFILGHPSDHYSWNDFEVMKINEDGDSLWNRIFENSLDSISGKRSSYDYAYTIAPANDGGCIIPVRTRFEDDSDISWIIKIEESGETAWLQQYVNRIRKVKSIIPIRNQGYIMCGTQDMYGWGGQEKMFIMEIDKDGNDVWRKTYGVVGYDIDPRAMIISEEGYLLTGQKNNHENIHDQIFLMEINKSGDSLWCQAYGNQSSEYGYAIASTLDSGYVIAGTTNEYGTGDDDIWLIKTNQEGERLW